MVVLNGAPRAGKSSLARAMMDSPDEAWVNLGVDHAMAFLPERLRPGIGLRPGGERPDLEPVVRTLYAALFDSVAAHARQGLNVAVDVGIHDDYSRPLGVWEDARARLSATPSGSEVGGAPSGGLRPPATLLDPSGVGPSKVLWVGVRCPIEVTMARRAATGMAAPREMVERWERAVHAGKAYDLEIDTSVTAPEAGATAIRRILGER